MANYRFDDAAAPLANSGDTITTRVYLSLRDEIIAGELEPGHRILRRRISDRLGVSHVPVTEALLKLEIDGLVESRPLLGCRVRPLTLEDVRNDEILREAIECQAVRLCTENASDAELTRLMNHARQLDRVTADADPRSKLGMNMHREFHLQIAVSSGYPVLADELTRVWFRRLMRLNWIKSSRFHPVPKDWHEQLVREMLSRDRDCAEKKMREHVQFGQENDKQALEAYLQSDSLEQVEGPGISD